MRISFTLEELKAKAREKCFPNVSIDVIDERTEIAIYVSPIEFKTLFDTTRLSIYIINKNGNMFEASIDEVNYALKRVGQLAEEIARKYSRLTRILKFFSECENPDELIERLKPKMLGG